MNKLVSFLNDENSRIPVSHQKFDFLSTGPLGDYWDVQSPFLPDPLQSLFDFSGLGFPDFEFIFDGPEPGDVAAYVPPDLVDVPDAPVPSRKRKLSAKDTAADYRKRKKSISAEVKRDLRRTLCRNEHRFSVTFVAKAGQIIDGSASLLKTMDIAIGENSIEMTPHNRKSQSRGLDAKARKCESSRLYRARIAAFKEILASLLRVLSKR